MNGVSLCSLDKIFEFINMCDKSKDIILLKELEVLKWVFGKTEFLKSYYGKTLKEKEYNFGKKYLNLKFPEKKIKTQWTNLFGEVICKEIMLLMEQTPYKPLKVKNYQLDLETKEWIIEVKTGTFFTSGTACEKILGTPFKYAEVPELFKKPLKIICVAGAEKKCRDYKNIHNEQQTICNEKRKLLGIYKEMKIEFLGACELLIKIIK